MLCIFVLTIKVGQKTAFRVSDDFLVTTPLFCRVTKQTLKEMALQIDASDGRLDSA